MAGGTDLGTLIGRRVVLEPLRVEHAREMSVLLRDPTLYAFTGGTPPTLAALTTRYRAQAAGRSPDGTQQWVNLVVRLRNESVAIGYVQATVVDGPDGPTAELAWLIDRPHQSQGYAREAASMLLTALRARGVRTVRANIRADHQASCAVARRLGLSPTGVLVDGEMRWQATGRPTPQPDDEPGRARSLPGARPETRAIPRPASRRRAGPTTPP